MPGKRGWRPKTSYRLVMVEWEDSQRPLDPWVWVDEYTMPEPIRCVSVGFLLAETEQALAIAPNLGDIAFSRAQACGIIRIPARSVLRMRDL